MIKVDKLMKDIIKDRYAKNPKNEWKYCIDRLHVSSNSWGGESRCAWTNSKGMYIMNIVDNAIVPTNVPINILSLFNDEEHTKAKFYDMFRDYANNIDVCIFKAFDDEDSLPVFVDNKLFDYINEYDYIKIKGPKDPVYVYYKNNIIAILIPIKKGV